MKKKLLKWISDLFSKTYKCEFVSDVPDSPKPSIIYFIGSDEYYWQAVMVCPCGCRKLLHMNLMDEHNPYWKYKIDKKKRVTLLPSVYRMVGCKSHFFIQKGKIAWV